MAHGHYRYTPCNDLEDRGWILCHKKMTSAEALDAMKKHIPDLEISLRYFLDASVLDDEISNAISKGIDVIASVARDKRHLNYDAGQVSTHN